MCVCVCVCVAEDNDEAGGSGSHNDPKDAMSEAENGGAEGGEDLADGKEALGSSPEEEAVDERGQGQRKRLHSAASGPEDEATKRARTGPEDGPGGGGEGEEQSPRYAVE